MGFEAIVKQRRVPVFERLQWAVVHLPGIELNCKARIDARESALEASGWNRHKDEMVDSLLETKHMEIVSDPVKHFDSKYARI